MNNPHDAQAEALAKLHELITAIQSATAALRPPAPVVDRPDTIESRIVEAVRARGRVSMGDLGRMLGEPKQRIHHHGHAVAMRRDAPVVLVKRPDPDGSRRDILVAYDARWFPRIDDLGPYGATAVATAGTEHEDTPIPPVTSTPRTP